MQFRLRINVKKRFQNKNCMQSIFLGTGRQRYIVCQNQTKLLSTTLYRLNVHYLFCWYGMRFECALLSGVINLLKEASGICSRSWSALALICETRIVQFTLLAVATSIYCIVGFHQWSKPREIVCTRWWLLLWHETCGDECIFFIHRCNLLL